MSHDLKKKRIIIDNRRQNTESPKKRPATRNADSDVMGCYKTNENNWTENSSKLIGRAFAAYNFCDLKKVRFCKTISRDEGDGSSNFVCQCPGWSGDIFLHTYVGIPHQRRKGKLSKYFRFIVRFLKEKKTPFLVERFAILFQFTNTCHLYLQKQIVTKFLCPTHFVSFCSFLVKIFTLQK